MVERILSCPAPSSWAARIAASAQESPDGCWVWQGALDRYGYGRFWYTISRGSRRRTGSHRAAWLALRGDIPDGLVTDHLCRNRACVNPWHMELVSNQENTIRGYQFDKPGRRTRRKPKPRTFCGTHQQLDGYLHTGPSGYTRWVCRICARANMARWKARQAA